MAGKNRAQAELVGGSRRSELAGAEGSPRAALGSQSCSESCAPWPQNQKYTNDNAARELWVDAVNVGGSAPVATSYHTFLPGVRHTTTATPAPTPSPTPPSGGVTVQAEGGAMLYGKGGFQAPNVVPGQERLDEGGALSSPP